MQENGTFDLKNEIRLHWKKDPSRLLQSIRARLKNQSSFEQAKDLLQQIRNSYLVEGDKDVVRKQMSREIGKARKAKEECSNLISRVSELSKEIKELKSSREENVQKIATLLKKPAQSPTPSVSIPRHFSDKLSRQPKGDGTSEQYLLKAPPRESDWSRFVESCEHATLYHDIRWHKLLKRNFGHETHLLASHNRKDEITGVMPLSHLKSKLFGSFTVSMPYFNYGGPLATDTATENWLMKQAAHLSENLGCKHMEIRETAPRDGWLCSKKKVSMVLTLPKTDEDLDDQLGAKLRAQIKRASHYDLTVESGGAELVEPFYSVYSHNMRDLGTPAYSVQFFCDIADTFTKETSIIVVKKNTRVVAAGFLLGYRDKTEIPWASSLRKYNHTNANMLLYRTALSEAIRRRYAFFDFGRSTLNASTYKFKKQWGAKEFPLYWHYWTSNGELPEINPDNPKYKLVIAAWKRMPVIVTRVAGPYIACNLP